MRGESRDEGWSGSATIAKAPILLGKNAKTRWGEPAGRFAWSRLAVAVLVEAAGIEPASRGVSATASTCVVDSLNFALPSPVDRVRT